jgi:DNA-binding response OmpR family regulator
MRYIEVRQGRKVKRMTEHMPSPPRLLVIDDDPDLRLFLQEIFTDEGYAVDLGATQNEALTLIDAHVYHLIITDLLTHSSLDPLRFAISVQQRAHPTPVIALTGWIVFPAEVAQAGLTRLIAKPFDLDNLLTTVASCMTPTMSAEQQRWAAIVDRWCEAFTAGDLAACVARCANDVTVSLPQSPQLASAETAAPLAGRATFRAYLEQTRRAMPALRFDEFLVHPQPEGLALRGVKSWEAPGAAGRINVATTLTFQFVGERISQITIHSSERSWRPTPTDVYRPIADPPQS